MKNKPNKLSCKPNKTSTSKIAPEIHRMALANRKYDVLDECREASGCGYEFAMEDLFRIATACWLTTRLKDALKGDFHTLVYCPNTVVEAECGFDLSLGHLKLPNRIRLAHKYCEGWCDESGMWYPSPGDERERVKKHFGNLARSYKDSNETRHPFLVLHVCKCLHDYRRMGRTSNGVRIPRLEDRRRTVVVDLAPITEKVLSSDKFRIVIRRDKEPTAFYVTQTHGPENELQVMGLQGLLKYAKEWLAKKD